MIKFKEAELNKLRSVVKRYNAKIRYYNKKWPDVYLPAPARVRDIRKMKYRRDYNIKLREMEKFLKTRLKVETTPAGAVTTNYQLQLLRDRDRLKSHTGINIKTTPHEFFDRLMSASDNKTFKERNDDRKVLFFRNYKQAVYRVFGGTFFYIGINNRLNELGYARFCELYEKYPELDIDYIYGPEELAVKFYEIMEVLDNG